MHQWGAIILEVHKEKKHIVYSEAQSKGTLPQVFQVISFQLLSVVCWGYYLENSFSPTDYDIHWLLFVVWNSEKHFYDHIFIHSLWSLQIFIWIYLFLLLPWFINVGIRYDFYLLFWWLKRIPRKKSWRGSTWPACVLTRNSQSTVLCRKPVWASANQVITLIFIIESRYKRCTQDRVLGLHISNSSYHIRILQFY